VAPDLGDLRRGKRARLVDLCRVLVERAPELVRAAREEEHQNRHERERSHEHEHPLREGGTTHPQADERGRPRDRDQRRGEGAVASAEPGGEAVPAGVREHGVDHLRKQDVPVHGCEDGDRDPPAGERDDGSHAGVEQPGLPGVVAARPGPARGQRADDDRAENGHDPGERDGDQEVSADERREREGPQAERERVHGEERVQAEVEGRPALRQLDGRPLTGRHQRGSSRYIAPPREIA
jgi:hypothetical protein